MAMLCLCKYAEKEELAGCVSNAMLCLCKYVVQGLDNIDIANHITSSHRDSVVAAIIPHDRERARSARSTPTAFDAVVAIIARLAKACILHTP